MSRIAIKTHQDHELHGTIHELIAGQEYPARIAVEIPDHKEEGWIIANGILLDKTEYEIVEK